MKQALVQTSPAFKDGEEVEKEEPRSTPDLCVDDDLDLLGSEQKQTGSLSWRVYRTYWLAVGGLLAASILMSLLLMQGLATHFTLQLNCYRQHLLPLH